MPGGTMYSQEFEKAINHAMHYEVGPFWSLNPSVEAGLISTPAQRKAVGYVNDPDDTGGETKFGIAKNANPGVNIKKLTWQQAKAIYYEKYWIAGHSHKLPPNIAVLHFDGCINHGVARANRFLQLAAGTTPDGKVGPVTISKINTHRQIDVCKKICDLREDFYKQIVLAKPSQKKFLNGWLSRINSIRAITCK